MSSSSNRLPRPRRSTNIWARITRFRLVRPCARSAGQGRLGRSRRRFRHALGGRRQGRQAPVPTSPPRSRTPTASFSPPTRIARARRFPGMCWKSSRQEAPEGQARRARRVQRHHQGRGPGGDEDTRARSTWLWSTPISPAARSIIWSASICRRCCGASCPAPVRPAACNRSRCGWSATASSRSKNSYAREYWSLVAHLLTQADAPFTARLVGADGKKIDPPRHRRRRRGRGLQGSARNGRLLGRPPSRPSRPSAILTRPSPPRPCSRRPRASSASRRPAPCRSPSASMRASISAARRSASSPICAPTASISRRRRSRPRAA